MECPIVPKRIMMNQSIEGSDEVLDDISETSSPEVLLLAATVAQLRANAALARRDRLVVLCADAGHSAYRIGKALGLSQQGVLKLLRRHHRAPGRSGGQSSGGGREKAAKEEEALAL
jgi:hypothetical protein